MINFEEELKKFKPSLEIEDAEDIIYNQDLDDMSDVLIKLLKDAKKKGTVQDDDIIDALKDTQCQARIREYKKE